MTAVLPAAPDTRRRVARLRGPVLLAGGLMGASLLLHVRDPHQQGSWGVCPWLVLTGTYCPGCGGLRAVNDLTRGDVGAAASSNLLFVATIPVLAGWWLRTVADRWSGRVRRAAARRHTLLAFGFLGLAVAFAVVRNLPAGVWLAP